MKHEWLAGLFKPTKLKRLLFFLCADIFIIAASFYFSFYLRFGFVFPEEWLKSFGFLAILGSRSFCWLRDFTPFLSQHILEVD